MKKATTLLLGSFCIFLSMAFVDRSNSLRPAPPLHAPAGKMSLDPKLYWLYLDNSDLARLVNLTHPNVKRIVFQFMYNRMGQLTLAAHGGKTHRMEHNIKFSPALTVLTDKFYCDSCEGEKPDPSTCTIDGKAVVLADQEIDSATFAHLVAASSDASIKFIIFVPKICKINEIDPPGSGNRGRFYVTYNLYHSDKLPTKDDVGFTGIVGFGSTTNPSPPHGGN